jgi:energy-coupling factor transporter ATP-binding protein EcfA2
MNDKTFCRTVRRPASAAITIGWLAVLFFSFGYAAQQAKTYPGRLGIIKADYLFPEESQVEERFATYLETHTAEAIGRYVAKYGKEISTDNARELSQDYAPAGMDVENPAAIAARTKWGEAVFQPARAFSRELYRRALKQETPSQQRRQVVFTAGGAGSGKSTSIRQLAGIARTVEAAEIIYDTTLSDLKSGTERIKEGLDAGRMVSIVFIYRDPVDALIKGVFPRAKATGRVPTLGGFLNTHLGAVETFLKIAALYKNDSRVAIAVIDNSRGIDYATLSDPKFIESIAGKYSRESLKTELTRATETAHEKGKKGESGGLPEILYQAFNRHMP